MNTYDPDEAVEDQAADAMQWAVAICKAAGWSLNDVKSLAEIMHENVEPASPAKEASCG